MRAVKGSSAVSSPYRTTVIDAGGRYGLHPSWKGFDGELDYYIFEPDQLEARRLAEKYARRADEVKVIGRAIAKSDGELKIRFLRNRAMSGSVERKPISSLFKGERLEQVDVVDVVSFINHQRLWPARNRNHRRIDEGIVVR